MAVFSEENYKKVKQKAICQGTSFSSMKLSVEGTVKKGSINVSIYNK